MAHDITATDTVILNQAQAWHGLGIVLPEAPGVDDAIMAARLQWDIEQLPLTALRETAPGVMTRITVDTHVANLRSDTGEVLGVVTSGYKPVQNTELAQFILDVADANRDLVKIESAGSIQGGRKVWFLAQTHSMLTVGKDDRIQPYVLFSNAHDGSAACRVTPTAIRVVCKNTYDATMREADRKEAYGTAISIRHTGDIKAKVANAREAIIRSMKGIEEFDANVQRINAAKFGSDLAVATGQATAHGQMMTFFQAVYERAFGLVPTKIESAADQKQRDKAEKIVAQWFANMSGERQNLPGIQGSVWAALNAVTEWSDHRPARGSDDAARDDAKVFRNLWGTGKDLKHAAFSTALQLATT